MVKTCCVRNCDIAPKENVTCFRFPNNRLQRRKWVDAVGLSSKLTGSATVCIRHFLVGDYDIVRGRPRLKAKVVPSVFGEMDKQPLLQSITEDDVTSNKVNTDVTFASVHKNNLNLPAGSINLHNERTKIQDESNKIYLRSSSKDVNIEGGTESQKEKKTELRNEYSRDIHKNEGSTKLHDKKNSVVRNKDSIESHDESKKKSPTENEDCPHSNAEKRIRTESLHESQAKNEESTDLSNECSTKSQNKRSKKSESEGSAQNNNENGDVEEVQISSWIKPNGVIPKGTKKGYQDSFIESTVKSIGAAGAGELSSDIEDIIVNYQIKQTRPLHDVAAAAVAAPDTGEIHVVDDVDDFDDGFGKESDPVFIELAVQGAGDRAGSPRDCLMVLESVQVELDPSSFLHGEPAECSPLQTVVLDDDEHDEDRRQDPISLLTSSDEDEVIIQEPHIDTVEVSDETDEDDVPLVKLLKKPKKKRKPKISIWNPYEYFCMDCQFTASNSQEYHAHAAKHSTILQVCEICDYTTASKSQFSKHKRKHREDKKFKCHLCDYKARHNMSLIYHLKSHRALSSAKKGFKCDKCGFMSDVKTLVLKHVKLCSSNIKKYSCDLCVYETKRPSDLKRHRARRHNCGPEDDDEFVP